MKNSHRMQKIFKGKIYGNKAKTLSLKKNACRNMVAMEQCCDLSPGKLPEGNKVSVTPRKK